MSTSDALQMAMELDPQGVRTIGVITKVNYFSFSCIIFERLISWIEEQTLKE